MEGTMDLNLKIKEIKKFNQYILQDTKTKKQYSLILEFYKVDAPKVNDMILLNEDLVNPKNEWFSQPYTFEVLDADEFNINQRDIAGLITRDKKYILKRIYG